MTTQQAVMDAITGGEGGGLLASGSVAMRLLSSGFNVNALRTNAVLRKDEWIQLDQTVVEVARQRLVGVGDLLSRGLRFGVGNALGTTSVEWERISDMTAANISMSGVTAGERDRVQFDLKRVPLPIVHKDFEINIRALEASRRNGTPLDTTTAALATRLVTEKIEDLLFNGGFVAGTGHAIEGYRTATNRNTSATGADWTTDTGEEILADLLTMIAAEYADNMYGPYMVYVSNAAYVHLGSDFKANSDKTILQRLKEVPGILDIKPSFNMPDDQVILVQFTSDVVDMIDGIQPMVVQWESHGGMLLHFKVMAIMVPRMKSDFANQSGIFHSTAAP